jgi:hypothetical protein
MGIDIKFIKFLTCDSIKMPIYYVELNNGNPVFYQVTVTLCPVEVYVYIIFIIIITIKT